VSFSVMLQKGPSPILGAPEKLSFLWTLRKTSNFCGHQIVVIVLECVKGISVLKDKARLEDLHVDFSVDIKLNDKLLHRASQTGNSGFFKLKYFPICKYGKCVHFKYTEMYLHFSHETLGTCNWNRLSTDQL